MKGSLTIFTAFGIPVKLHWTFVGILPYVVFLAYRADRLDTVPWLLGLFLLMFVSVTLHEYGHALTARVYGVTTKDIILSPIGGIARLTRLPEKPYQEFLIAAAGPFVNLVLGAALLIGWVAVGSFGGLRQVLLSFYNSGLVLDSFVELLALLVVLNVMLAVFNCLPAFPMDGGRMLRALLSIPFSRVLATRIASLLGQLTAGGMMLFGLYSQDYILVLIGFFIFYTAAAEFRGVVLEDRLRRMSVRDAMRTGFTLVQPNDTVGELSKYFADDGEDNFLVEDPEQPETLIGVVEDRAFYKALKKKANTLTVTELMLHEVQVVAPTDTLWEAFGKMQEHRTSILAVRDDTNELLGVVDLSGINYRLSKKGRRELAYAKARPLEGGVID